jgi:hypothetical protein
MQTRSIYITTAMVSASATVTYRARVAGPTTAAGSEVGSAISSHIICERRPIIGPP